jgi:hypothetical protein
MPHYVSGIFLDFDNVFGSLFGSNSEAAVNFASDPRRWLSLFSNMKGDESDDTSHKFVIRRCYMNPSGRVKTTGGGSEYFSKYRQLFVRDGWEVIDTPQLTRQGKTSADIHIVMDVLDAVTYYPHVSEYIIMAADADFTPLVTRLRKQMKKTVIYQAKATAAAYTAACDSAIEQEDFIELLLEEEPDEEPEHQEKTVATTTVTATAEPQTSLLSAQLPLTPERVADFVKRYFAESGSDYKAPVMSILNMLKVKFGPEIANGWLGYPSASQMLRKVCGLQVHKVENRTLAWVEEDDGTEQ